MDNGVAEINLSSLWLNQNDYLAGEKVSGGFSVLNNNDKSYSCDSFIVMLTGCEIIPQKIRQPRGEVFVSERETYLIEEEGVVTLSNEINEHEENNNGENFYLFTIQIPQKAIAPSFDLNYAKVEYDISVILKDTGETIKKEIINIIGMIPSMERLERFIAPHETKIMTNTQPKMDLQINLFKGFFHPGDNLIAMLSLKNCSYKMINPEIKVCLQRKLHLQSQKNSLDDFEVEPRTYLEDAVIESSLGQIPGFKTLDHYIKLQLPDSLVSTVSTPSTSITYQCVITVKLLQVQNDNNNENKKKKKKKKKPELSTRIPVLICPRERIINNFDPTSLSS
eukprot:TRINITY_DN1932_c0_g1_i2.p1 TRINITY_DN1932_c0_g1~~TRINITY_DN1932_c0_g1_i2.p1  ORF type:complete len:337 (+),score=93.22 TRINITY_DN1932_c0_g1_i2:76-1086(+)